jgi:addiction module HigA family antidote
MSQLLIITEVLMAIHLNPNHPGAPVHPGEMLREEFMVPLGISANGLAMALRVPSTRISEIVAERRSITADTAYRLACYFGMPAQFWMSLQSNYELAVAYKHAQTVIKKEVRPRVA